MSNERVSGRRGAPVVGMVGGGQLARMTHQAAVNLDVTLLVLAKASDQPAIAAGAGLLVGLPDDPLALARLAERSDVITFDHEHVPVALATELAARGHAVRPRGEALAYAQDKLLARRRFARLGLAVPAFAALGDDAGAEVDAFARVHGWPLVIKRRTGGYDGRGVFVVRDALQAREVIARAGAGGGGLLVEAYVDLARELAVVGARSASGAWQSYPLVETRQVDGILHDLVMPAAVPAAQAREAEAMARTIAEGIDATGIVAVELFVSRGGGLSVNEIALRPHNSGHATIEAAATSQFENHLRAVLDWPLGSTRLRAPAAATVNILGPSDGSDPRARLDRALAVPGASVHLYGKDPMPGRKLGHVTVLADDTEEALALARRCAAILHAEL